MTTFQVNDDVHLCAFCLGFPTDREKQPEGNLVFANDKIKYKIVALGCQLPYGNDTVLRSDAGRVIFTRKAFLRPIEEAEVRAIMARHLDYVLRELGGFGWYVMRKRAESYLHHDGSWHATATDAAGARAGYFASPLEAARCLEQTVASDRKKLAGVKWCGEQLVLTIPYGIKRVDVEVYNEDGTEYQGPAPKIDVRCEL